MNDEKRAIVAKLAEAISKLKSPLREVMLMLDIMGLEEIQVATKLNMTRRELSRLQVLARQELEFQLKYMG